MSVNHLLCGRPRVLGRKDQLCPYRQVCLTPRNMLRFANGLLRAKFYAMCFLNGIHASRVYEAPRVYNKHTVLGTRITRNRQNPILTHLTAGQCATNLQTLFQEKEWEKTWPTQGRTPVWPSGLPLTSDACRGRLTERSGAGLFRDGNLCLFLLLHRHTGY